jgi:hypothetical protein
MSLRDDSIDAGLMRASVWKIGEMARNRKTVRMRNWRSAGYIERVYIALNYCTRASVADETGMHIQSRRFLAARISESEDARTLESGHGD